MSLASERRTDRRLDLNLDVEFTPRKLFGSMLPCVGKTCNVSAGGVYFETGQGSAVEHGTDMILKIAIPNRDEGATEPLALHCEGRVVRVVTLAGPEDDRHGVAVQFKNRPNVEFQSLTHSLWGID